MFIWSDIAIDDLTFNELNCKLNENETSISLTSTLTSSLTSSIGIQPTTSETTPKSSTTTSTSTITATVLSSISSAIIALYLIDLKQRRSTPGTKSGVFR